MATQRVRGDATAITVAIDAALDVAGGSGAERGLAALVGALDNLDGDDRYLIVTSPLAPRWVAPYTGHRARIVVAPRSFADPASVRQLRLRARLRRLAGPLLPFVRRLRRRSLLGGGALAPRSDPFFGSLGAHVIHFAFQQYVRTSLPSIFEPLDLQHRHLPENFTASEIAWREATYTAACTEADAIVAPSFWMRSDLIAELGLAPTKVYRILRPATPLADAPSDAVCRAARERFRLPETFLFYPAQTWVHKNHLRLIDALAQARRTTPVTLVCSGTQTEHFAIIRRRVRELELQDAIRFVGHVTASEMRALYRLARGLIFPSLHEGASMVLIEAFTDDLACAASNITGLPEIAGDAALLFDPTSVSEIAEAMVRLWTDPALRDTLVRSGRRRLPEFDPVVIARTYRALYRSAAGRALSPDDEKLLADARSDPHGGRG